MGCTTCGNKSVNLNVAPKARRVQELQAPIGPCDYTDEILTVWADKLKWFKNKGLYVNHGVEARVLNKYLGTVLTSINSNKKCRFQQLLDNEINTLITYITGLQNV